MPMTESAIDDGFFRHLYVALGDQLGNNAWLVRVHYKPLIGWIWYGCLLMALGGVLAASDRRYRSAAKAAQAGAIPGGRRFPRAGQTDHEPLPASAGDIRRDRRVPRRSACASIRARCPRR